MTFLFWLIRVLSTLFLFFEVVWFCLMTYVFYTGIDNSIKYHEKLFLILFLGISILFTLLVYPICSYLEKKLKE